MSTKTKSSLVVFSLFAATLPFQNCAPFRPVAKKAEANISFSIDAKCTNDLHVRHPAPQKLTKDEYNNVIRDLFGITQNFSQTFSDDSVGLSGFNTDSDSQNITAEGVNDYWDASSRVVDAVFAQSSIPFMTCTSGTSCATTLINNLTLRAFRRPASTEEVQTLVKLFNKDASTDFKVKMKTVVQAILVSPQFIFRTLQIPSGTAPVKLTSYELASRISFFIWGSIPDKELLDMAANGDLEDLEKVRIKVRSMVQDVARSRYLSRSFASQWLELGKLSNAVRSTSVFPTWSTAVRDSMKEETLVFMDHIISENRKVSDIVAGNFTYLNSSLANHYGVSGSFGSSFAYTTLDANRRGILTQGSFLAMTAAEDYTSPIKRGKWILANVLCSEPDAPPPNVPPLPADPSGDDLVGESTIRRRLEAHRKTGTTCAFCHQSMDPIGLSLENFTAAGTFRTKYNDGVVVDASGVLPTGERLYDAIDLINVVRDDPRFPSCLSAKMNSFALGTDMKESFKNCGVQKLGESLVKSDASLTDLIEGIVTTDEFRHQRAN